MDIQEHVQQQACRTVHIHPSPDARHGLLCGAQEDAGDLRLALTRCSLNYNCISEHLNNNLPGLRDFSPPILCWTVLGYSVQKQHAVSRSWQWVCGRAVAQGCLWDSPQPLLNQGLPSHRSMFAPRPMFRPSPATGEADSNTAAAVTPKAGKPSLAELCLRRTGCVTGLRW